MSWVQVRVQTVRVRGVASEARLLGFALWLQPLLLGHVMLATALHTSDPSSLYLKYGDKTRRPEVVRNKPANA